MKGQDILQNTAVIVLVFTEVNIYLIDNTLGLNFHLITVNRQMLSDLITNRQNRKKFNRQPSIRGTQREYSSNPHKHSIVENILVFKRWI